MRSDAPAATPATAFPVETVLLAFGLFLLCVPVVFVGLGLLPVALSPAVDWLLVVSIVIATSLFAAARRPPSERRRAVLWAMGVLLVFAVTSDAAFDAFSSWFSAYTVDLRTASPDGRLVATRETQDDGALGASTVVMVRGRLLPGVVSWSYAVPTPGDGEDCPQRIGWLDDRTLIVDGKRYTIPGYIVSAAR